MMIMMMAIDDGDDDDDDAVTSWLGIRFVVAALHIQQCSLPARQYSTPENVYCCVLPIV